MIKLYSVIRRTMACGAFKINDELIMSVEHCLSFEVEHFCSVTVS